MANFALPDNNINKKTILIDKINRLLKTTSCNSSEMCNKLLDNIQNTKDECNVLFRPPPGDPDYDYTKGIFIRDSACADLTTLQKKIAAMNGGNSKRNKSKRNKSKRNKSKSKRRKTLRR